jgi:hypothetical protein
MEIMVNSFFVIIGAIAGFVVFWLAFVTLRGAKQGFNDWAHKRAREREHQLLLGRVAEKFVEVQKEADRLMGSDVISHIVMELNNTPYLSNPRTQAHYDQNTNRARLQGLLREKVSDKLVREYLYGNYGRVLHLLRQTV